MPLSKAKDKERKHKERAKLGLDKLLSPPQTLNPVQPSDTYTNITYPEVDADGNPIYEDA